MKAAAAANRSTAGNRTKGSQTQTLPLKLRRMPMQSRQRYQSECKKPAEVARQPLGRPFSLRGRKRSDVVVRSSLGHEEAQNGARTDGKTQNSTEKMSGWGVSDLRCCSRHLHSEPTIFKYVRGTSNQNAKNNVRCTCG